MTGENNLKVLFVSAEVAPFAKTGGLADVAGSLPKELALMGIDIRVAMPRYKLIKSDMEYVTDFAVQIGGKKETCIVRKEKTDDKSKNGAIGVPVYFIDSYNYFDRSGIYCYFDDAERFAFLCKAALEMLPRINFQPDIIHCNDWHTGPICMLLNEVYKDHPFYKNIATIYTIHNLEYQGNFSGDTLKLFNVGYEIFTPEKVEFYGMFSFMKAGLVYADILNTVSKEYSKEIQTERYGEKMEGVLQKRSEDLYGIVNGISYKEFNPETDPRIYRNYNAQNYKLKKDNKYALQRELGLPVTDVPVIGLVSRLSEQKGLELILDKLEDLMKLDIQFVLLGTGDEHYETAFRNAKLVYPKKVGVYIGFNTDLAQRIYAGCDMFLMPSRFEPCGLGQIISLRYGAIPIVRATGGLAETIVDFDDDNVNGNGFVFKEFSSDEMLDAIKRALKLYNESPDVWSNLVKRALVLDFSWSRPAKKYIELYERAIKKKSTKG
ncbi:MAG TPA: glycogen synthase GlgA [Clostridiaceae bacterium]|nr:glycogen synthase GlgA [Clostridiaceae bacterium]